MGPTNTATAAVTRIEGIPMDPRTKLLMVVVTNICVITVVKTPVTLSALAIMILMFAAARAWKFLLPILALFVGFMAIHELSGYVPHWIGALLAVIGQYGSRITVVIGMGVWLFATTTPAAFIAALKRAHVPDAFTVPLSVMFRFFPAALEEIRAIWDAMRLRGLFITPGQAAAHPLRAAEYVMVPLVGSTLQIADDLSVSAMTRGLGRPGRTTSVVHTGFGWGDAVGFALMLGLIAVFVMNWKGITL